MYTSIFLQYEDTPNKKQNHHQTQVHLSVRLRVLRLENVPDCDASPFSNGDFYINASLESEKFKKIQPSEPVGGSQYGRAQFQPVSARESVKVLSKTMRCCLNPVQEKANSSLYHITF